MEKLEGYIEDSILLVDDAIKNILNGKRGVINFSSNYIYNLINTNYYIGYSESREFWNDVFSLCTPEEKEVRRQKLIKDESLRCFKNCLKHKEERKLFILYYVNTALNNIAKIHSGADITSDVVWCGVHMAYDIYGIISKDRFLTTNAYPFLRLMKCLINNDEIAKTYIIRIEDMYDCCDYETKKREFPLYTVYNYAIDTILSNTYNDMHMDPAWHHIDIKLSK